jgi:hypothetical protein
MRSSRTRSLAASAIALISAAFVAQAIPASASTAIRPGPGALDPKFMVLTPADLAPGSKVTAQRYYKDSDFPSVISYAREFDRGRVGLTSFLHSESDAEIGVGETSTQSFLRNIRLVFSSKSTRAKLAKQLAKQIGTSGGLVTVTSIGRPRGLGVGASGSFDLVIGFRLLGARTDFHIAVFRVERILGTVLALGEPGKAVPLAAIRHLASVMAARMGAQLLPTNTALPVISGTPQAAMTLTADPGAWAGAPPTFTYQWQRCDASGQTCTDVPTATGQTYMATWMDVGRTVRVSVTATTAVGTATAVSDQTAAVAAAPVSLWPANTSLPTIFGVLRGGETLTATAGSWSANPTTFFFTWQRCDTTSTPTCLPTGGHSQTYVLTGADLDHLMFVYVIACNAAGCGSARSAPTSVVQ